MGIAHYHCWQIGSTCWLRWLRVSLLGWCFVLSFGLPAWAHHGGLGIEGDLVEWALKVDQWQDERIDQGYRIKFLSYPRQPILQTPTRLVFEIQSVTTGRYISNLTPQLAVQAPDGTQRLVSLPETTGVTAYYETTLTFAQRGEHALTLSAATADGPFRGTFHKVVRPNVLFGDWPTVVGHLTILAAFSVTWISMVLSLQRRFRPHEDEAPGQRT